MHPSNDIKLSLNKLSQKIGIIGGGQLGKMLCQAGSKLGLDISVMDKDLTFPSAQICRNFVSGDINNYDDVLQFGLDKDVITIEIENINVSALEDLEKMGKLVYPKPSSLRIIRDKGLQKEFYLESGFPSSTFSLHKSKSETLQAVSDGNLAIPFVQKLRSDGYDGKGVHIVRSEIDLDQLMDGTTLIEEIVDIDKEIAVIVARNPSGDLRTFPVVEMHFHPTANLVEYLFCPSTISSELEVKADKIAKKIAVKLDIVGLLAVEMFVTKNGDLLVNEVAPRPHNSGHHTIEACVTSQYEMHLRAILGLPLGDTSLFRPAVMVNLLGEKGFSGPVNYEGIEDCLEIEGVYPHLYGKKETKPFRKMGHVTILDETLEKAIEKAKFVQNTLKVIS